MDTTPLFRPSRAACVAAGLLVGLLAGLGLRSIWPATPVAAVSTHSQETFAVATGLIDQSTEGVFYLDYLTGDLKAAVLGARQPVFTNFFKYNVLGDFVGIGKNPKFTLTTGIFNFPRGAGNAQFGQSVVYVAESTTGQVAAYAIPWNPSAASSGKPQGAPFIKLDVKPFRAVVE